MDPRTYLNGLRLALEADSPLPNEQADETVSLSGVMAFIGELRALRERVADWLAPHDAVQLRKVVGELEPTIYDVSAAAARAGYEQGLADGMHLGLYQAAAHQAGPLPPPSGLLGAVLGQAPVQSPDDWRQVQRRAVTVSADEVKEEIGRRIRRALRRLAEQLRTGHPDLAAALAGAAIPSPEMGCVQLVNLTDPNVRIRLRHPDPIQAAVLYRHQDQLAQMLTGPGLAVTIAGVQTEINDLGQIKIQNVSDTNAADLAPAGPASDHKAGLAEAQREAAAAIDEALQAEPKPEPAGK